jgi:hypothetical protein
MEMVWIAVLYLLSSAIAAPLLRQHGRSSAGICRIRADSSVREFGGCQQKRLAIVWKIYEKEKKNE